MRFTIETLKEMPRCSSGTRRCRATPKRGRFWLIKTESRGKDRPTSFPHQLSRSPLPYPVTLAFPRNPNSNRWSDQKMETSTGALIVLWIQAILSLQASRESILLRQTSTSRITSLDISSRKFQVGRLTSSLDQLWLFRKWIGLLGFRRSLTVRISRTWITRLRPVTTGFLTTMRLTNGQCQSMSYE